MPSLIPFTIDQRASSRVKSHQSWFFWQSLLRHISISYHTECLRLATCLCLFMPPTCCIGPLPAHRALRPPLLACCRLPQTRTGLPLGLLRRRGCHPLRRLGKPLRGLSCCRHTPCPIVVVVVAVRRPRRRPAVPGSWWYPGLLSPTHTPCCHCGGALFRRVTMGWRELALCWWGPHTEGPMSEKKKKKDLHH